MATTDAKPTTSPIPQPPSTPTPLDGTQSNTRSTTKSSHRPSSSTSSTDPNRLSRPPIGSRKSSGTIIVPRSATPNEIQPTDETYDPDDARAMSPRRSSDEIDRMGTEGRKEMVEQAQTLQSNLLEIIERVDGVKSEQERLEGGNRFLQSYIGELMQTSKLTSVGAGKGRKGRSGKS